MKVLVSCIKSGIFYHSEKHGLLKSFVGIENPGDHSLSNVYAIAITVIEGESVSGRFLHYFLQGDELDVELLIDSYLQFLKSTKYELYIDFESVLALKDFSTHNYQLMVESDSEKYLSSKVELFVYESDVGPSKNSSTDDINRGLRKFDIPMPINSGRVACHLGSLRCHLHCEYAVDLDIVTDKASYIKEYSADTFLYFSIDGQAIFINEDALSAQYNQNWITYLKSDKYYYKLLILRSLFFVLSRTDKSDREYSENLAFDLRRIYSSYSSFPYLGTIGYYDQSLKNSDYEIFDLRDINHKSANKLIKIISYRRDYDSFDLVLGATRIILLSEGESLRVILVDTDLPLTVPAGERYEIENYSVISDLIQFVQSSSDLVLPSIMKCLTEGESSLRVMENFFSYLRSIKIILNAIKIR